MNDLAVEYGLRHGSIDKAVVNFVNDLMAGDAPTFKQGYSYRNAVIAAAEAFDLNENEVYDIIEGPRG